LYFKEGGLGRVSAVKENEGAAGIDDQSIEDFEKKLKKNPLKIWNRWELNPIRRASGNYYRFLHRSDTGVCTVSTRRFVTSRSSTALGGSLLRDFGKKAPEHNERRILRDGWNELPCGGAVRVKNDVPVEVSDQGRWNLDEGQILTEAGKVTSSKITWFSLHRWQRWQAPGLLSIFSRGNMYRWSVAKVVPEACEQCGCKAGVKWVQAGLGDEVVWCCEACAVKTTTNEAPPQTEESC